MFLLVAIVWHPVDLFWGYLLTIIGKISTFSSKTVAQNAIPPTHSRPSLSPTRQDCTQPSSQDPRRERQAEGTDKRAHHEDRRCAPLRQTDPTGHGTVRHGGYKPSTSVWRSGFAGARQWLPGMTWCCCWGCHWSSSPQTAHSSPVESKSRSSVTRHTQMGFLLQVLASKAS